MGGLVEVTFQKEPGYPYFLGYNTPDLGARGKPQ
jgi:hypothetical protein